MAVKIDREHVRESYLHAHVVFYVVCMLHCTMSYFQVPILFLAIVFCLFFVCLSLCYGLVRETDALIDLIDLLID